MKSEIQQFEYLTLQETPEEKSNDFVPKNFDDYLGQKELKEKLSVYTTAAKMRNEALDHLLLFGPPGLGKTTLSQIMANVMQVGIKICSGPMLERTGDLIAILSGLDSRDILFIDEIHRMPANVEEVLYSAMEHFRVDVIIGQGAGAKTVNLPINSFTLIGATTKSGMISAPLRSRFGIIERLDFYTQDDLCKIVLQSSQFLNLQISENSAMKIAKCARGTPRIAKKILRRVRDFAQVNNENIADDCNGKRLNKEVLSVLINEKNIFDLSELSIKELFLFFKNLKLSDSEKEISKDLIKEILNRLNFLINVGLNYLSLNRSARTLSGGEGQRIRLATQIGSALSGVLYILDEPSIGLHQRDNDRLIETLKKLRDQGNTVVVVEHDIDTIKKADYLIDMGPAAGILGGKITASGTPKILSKDPNSLTGAYLSGKKYIAVPDKLRKPISFIELKNASKNNLKKLNVKFPLGVFCGVSGVSGSGKSTLILDELAPAVLSALIRPHSSRRDYSTFKPTESYIENFSNIKELVVIDQSPIGRTSRSNPATYLGIFDDIRNLFAQIPESKARGYSLSRFSFNVQEGRCFDCSGDGVIKVSMQFLPDVVMQCKACNGKKYNAKTLEIKFKDKSVSDVLEMTAYEALKFFENHVALAKRLQLMCDVGLDYIALGQSSTTLSGGEAQRIKLVKELAKRGNNTLYILDEPTTGLHNNDIEKLLKVLNKLIDKGNSMIVIEHNLDVLKTADYLIDLGPEGGDEGGIIVASGTPKQVAKSPNSHTGKYLKNLI